MSLPASLLHYVEQHTCFSGCYGSDSNVSVCLDPNQQLKPMVVVTGSVAKASDLLLEPVRQECARRVPPGMMDTLRVEFSPLGDDGVAIGAARIAATAGAA